MKEAIGKFRGWLDDLLDSAWEGCQNTDVLIESPSAIAGYHIAEALQIPYYRYDSTSLLFFLLDADFPLIVQRFHDALVSNPCLSPRLRCS